jgi:hypothetical protein
MRIQVTLSLALLSLSAFTCQAFVLLHVPSVYQTATIPRKTSPVVVAAAAKDAFEVTVQMPPTGSDLQASMRIEPILSVPSEIIEVRYKVPFGLNVEPKKGLAVVTADGEGGEKVGDVLRYTSHWSMGLPEGEGLATTAAAFSGGGLSWRCTMFNVMKAKAWEQVVQALLSNEQVRFYVGINQQ